MAWTVFVSAQGHVIGFCEHGNELADYIKCRNGYGSKVYTVLHY